MRWAIGKVRCTLHENSKCATRKRQRQIMYHTLVIWQSLLYYTSHFIQLPSVFRHCHFIFHYPLSMYNTHTKPTHLHQASNTNIVQNALHCILYCIEHWELWVETKKMKMDSWRLTLGCERRTVNSEGRKWIKLNCTSWKLRLYI